MDSRLDNIERRLIALEQTTGLANTTSSSLPTNENEFKRERFMDRDVWPYVATGTNGLTQAVIHVTGSRGAGKTTFVRDVLLPSLNRPVYLACMKDERRQQVFKEHRPINITSKAVVGSRASFYVPDLSTTVATWLHDHDNGKEFHGSVCFVVDEISHSPEANLLLDRLIKDTANADLPITWVLVSQSGSPSLDKDPFSGRTYDEFPTLHLRDEPRGFVDVMIKNQNGTYKWNSRDE